jgi:predicted secreted protein
MSNALPSYGTLLQLSDGASPPNYSSIAEIRSIGDVGGEREVIEVTHMESPGAWKEFLGGMIDSLDVSLDLNYLPQNPTHKAMLANLQQTALANVVNPYRITLPDYGATGYTATVSGSVWTTASTHGWNTPQPIVFSTTGALPTSTPQIVPGVTYWARYASSTTFTLFASSSNAAANTSQITFSTSGTGTHTVGGGSVLTFLGEFKNAKVTAALSDRLAIASTLKVTGPVTLTP